ncbi:MAG: hypothetical protein JWM55_202, partial [Acidimicrobiaceae bacterium]|nr:hypothetical protein [Acidimicrobiaceae bacterium]
FRRTHRKPKPSLTNRKAKFEMVERATRIELAFSAWEADVLPLNYARIFLYDSASLVM